MTQSELPEKPQLQRDWHLFPALQDAGDRRQLTVAQANALIAWADIYGLDAWQGHVLYMYGKPYVSEKGAIANAQKYKQYRGYVLTAVQPEERDELGLSDMDWGYRCEVYIDGLDHPFVEYGDVKWSEREELRKQVLRNLQRTSEGANLSGDDLERKVLEKLSYLPLWKHPDKMARARAIRRAHLLAFPLKGYDLNSA